MPQCCRCNGSGRCKNCSCKKAGRVCTNCLPSKKNQCKNLVSTSRHSVFASNFPSSSSSSIITDPSISHCTTIGSSSLHYTITCSSPSYCTTTSSSPPHCTTNSSSSSLCTTTTPYYTATSFTPSFCTTNSSPPSHFSTNSSSPSYCTTTSSSPSHCTTNSSSPSYCITTSSLSSFSTATTHYCTTTSSFPSYCITNTPFSTISSSPSYCTTTAPICNTTCSSPSYCNTTTPYCATNSSSPPNYTISSPSYCNTNSSLSAYCTLNTSCTTTSTSPHYATTSTSYCTTINSSPPYSTTNTLHSSALPCTTGFNTATPPILPPFAPSSSSNFMWGELSSEDFTSLVEDAYEKIVHFRRNHFEIPRGKAGKGFIDEINQLLIAYNDASALEGVAMKAIMVMPSLLLQRPHPKSKMKDHVRALEDRLSKWKKGDLASLLHEAQTIQDRLKISHHQHQNEGKIARTFEKLVLQGKIKAATRLITEHQDQGCLSLESIQQDGRTVKEHLQEKHPPRKPSTKEAISSNPTTTEPHEVIYQRIDAPLVRSMIQQMGGAAGPSGMDAQAWKRMCSSFGNSSGDLCNSIANLTKKLCSHYVDPKGISSLMACRLIALDKSPGVRPIGIGETFKTSCIQNCTLHCTR